MKKHVNAPKLRFPEFTGEWENKKLGEIGDIIGGGTPSTNNMEFWNGHIPWVSSSDLSEDSIFFVDIHRYITDDAVLKTATKIIPPFSILVVSRVGVGKIAVNNVSICTSQDFTNFLPFDANYIFIAFLLKLKTKKLLEFNQGTSIKGFVKSDFELLPIFIPSLPEQTKIANFLTAVDDKINQLKKKKDLLEKYKKGVMQKIFSQELRFKDDNGEEFAEWEEKKLGEILTIGSGKDYKHLENGEVPVFGTGGYMTSVNDWLYDGETICIGRKGTIDKPMYYKGKIWTVDTLFYSHKFVNCVPKFIYYVFQGINWKEYNEASGVPSLSKSTIEKICINIPSLPEQTKIANFLSSIDDKISQCGKEIEGIETWKKGLLQQMFV